MLLSGTAWQTLAQIAPLTVNLALTPYVIRTLGAVAFGLYIVTSTLGAFLGQFDGGIGRSAQRYFVLHAGTKDREGTTRLLATLLSIITVSTLAIFSLVFAFAPALVDFFHAPPELRDDMLFLFRVLIIGTGVALARNLFASILAAYQRFALTSLTWVAGYGVNAAGLVFVLSRGMGLRGIAYAFIAQQLFSTLTIIPSALPHLSRAGLRLLPRAQVREFFAFAWKVQVSGLVTLLGQQGTVLVVGRLAPLQVPYFGPGVTFAQQMRQLPVAAMRPIQSLLGRTLSGQGADAAVRQAAELQRVWAVFVCGWVVVGVPAVYVGVNIWLPLDSQMPGLVASIMLAGHLFALLPLITQIWAMLWGAPELEMRAGIVAVIVTLGLAIPSVSTFGAVAVAGASVIGQGAAYGYLLSAARRLPRPLPPMHAGLPWVAIALAAVASCLAAYGAGWASAQWHLPHGGIGLLLCALAAAPVLICYLAATIGLGRVRALMGRRGRA